MNTKILADFQICISVPLMKVPIALLRCLNIGLNIPGQHADNGQVSARNDLSLRHFNLPPAESRICTEFKEVGSGTISEDRIFGNSYRLNKDGNFNASGEACKTNVTMQASSREHRDYQRLPSWI